MERTPQQILPRAWVVWLALACSLCLGQTRAFAQAVSKEYQVKAVLLVRLAQFTQWPSNAFQTADSPIVIGVLGEDPFGSALDLAARGETAHGRPVVVQRFRRGEDIRSCHVVFVSASERSRVPEVLRATRYDGILTVSDLDDFATHLGGMVRFMNAPDRKVSLRINIDAVKAANLSLDARLLRMAEVVGSK